MVLPREGRDAPRDGVGVGQSNPSSQVVQPFRQAGSPTVIWYSTESAKEYLEGKNKKLKGELVREGRERGESLKEMKEGWH